MFNPPRIAVLAATITAALAIGACGSDNDNGSSSSGSGPSKASTALDINAQGRDAVKEGGTIRWAVDQYSTQWNYNQVNGPSSATADVIDALMPQPFIADEKANISPDPNFLTKAELTSEKPETVELTLNEKAKWSDGTPITAKDYIAQWKALSGKDPKFQIAGSTGYDQVKSVTENGSPYKVKVVFAKPFSEWNSLFSPLYPAKYQDTPDKFNKAYLSKIPVTAGPFKLGKLDKSGQSITVVRDPKWWGNPAKLDKIVFRALDASASVNAVVNGEIDYYDVGADASAYKRVSGTPGATIHEAGGPDFRHFTINGASGPLKDLRVRQAFEKAINREALAKSDLTGLGAWKPETMGSHLFTNTQEGYQDNSGEWGHYDPDGAKKLLDEAGWKQAGAFRSKDGKQLKIRFIIPSGTPVSKQEGELAQAMVKDVGINLDIVTVPTNDWADKYLIPGNFDVTPFSWLGTPWPLSSGRGIYIKPQGDNVQQNFGRIGSDEIDSLLDNAGGTFDIDKARDYLNQADALIWKEGHSIVLYQRPQIIATKKNLANVGAFGFKTKVYEDMGFQK